MRECGSIRSFAILRVRCRVTAAPFKLATSAAPRRRGHAVWPPASAIRASASCSTRCHPLSARSRSCLSCCHPRSPRCLSLTALGERHYFLARHRIVEAKPRADTRNSRPSTLLYIRCSPVPVPWSLLAGIPRLPGALPSAAAAPHDQRRRGWAADAEMSARTIK